MISEARISHYKSLSEATIQFNDINVIVGANGVGKSNILDALYFVRDCVVEDIDTAVIKRHGIESIRQWSKTKPYYITIEIKFSEKAAGHGIYRLCLSSARGSYKVVEEFGQWWGSHPLRVSKDGFIPRGYCTFKRNEAGEVGLNSDFSDLSLPKVPNISSSDLFVTSLGGRVTFASLAFKPLIDQFESFVSYSIYPNTLREPQTVSRDTFLTSDGSNIASILRKINSGHRRSKESIVDALKIIMPLASDITVKSAGGYYVPVIRVVEENGEGHEYNMSQISDGTLRVLGLLAAFYQPNAPKMIAIEEPEQMIHPGALPVIADAISEFAHIPNQQSQVFITTHSPNLLDLFKPEDIIWTTFKSGITECGKVNERQMKLIKDNLFSAGEVLTSEGFFG